VFRLARPPAAELRRWLAALESLPPPDAPEPGGVVDSSRVALGQGAEAFRRAREALGRWEMFRLGWAEVHPPAAPIRVGTTVAVLARIFGIWSLNPCRIVAVVEEGGAIERFGFVYRTLPGHAVDGEERFTVVWDHDRDAVAYEIAARSRPAHPLVRAGLPVARLVQRRFARDSMRAMVRATSVRPAHR
jgi:uncharacterized protein (UPF0548 family)